MQNNVGNLKMLLIFQTNPWPGNYMEGSNFKVLKSSENTNLNKRVSSKAFIVQASDLTEADLVNSPIQILVANFRAPNRVFTNNY